MASSGGVWRIRSYTSVTEAVLAEAVPAEAVLAGAVQALPPWTTSS